MMKKTISVLFIVCMMAICLLFLPSKAQAATVAEGVCGDDLTWILDNAGTLTVSGTGAMTTDSTPPWEEWKDQVINVILEPGVTSVSSNAFYSYASIKSLTVPVSITSIGSYAFAGNNNLESIYISDLAAWCNISFNYEYSNPLINGADLYLNGELVTNLVIPDGVSSIRSYTFYGYENLVSVMIPEGVTTIGRGAFRLSAIKSVALPESIANIGQEAFNSCSDLDHVFFAGTQSQWEEISIGSYNYSISNATLHFETSVTDVNNCKEIGAYCPVCDLYITEPKRDAIPHSYTDVTDVICDVCSHTRRLTAVSIIELPEKLGYCLEENLDVTGGRLLLTYDDGECGTITITEDMVSGFDSSVVGVQRVNVTYKGFTDTYPTEVCAVMPKYGYIDNVPSKVSYMVGEKLDLTNLRFYVYYQYGQEATGYGDEVQVWAETSTAGVHTAVALYRGVKKTFNIYVHDRQLDYLDKNQPHPESDHNYANNIDITKSVSLPIAEELVLVFDEKSATEKDRDFIYISDKNGNLIGKYSGDLANLEVTVPGTTAYIRLTSNSSNTAYGYKIKAVKVYRSVHLEEAVPDMPATCDTWGYTGCTACSLCNKVLEQGTRIRPYGHSYGEWVVVRPSNVVEKGWHEKSCATCGTIFWEYLPLLAPVAEWNVALYDDLQVNFYLPIEERLVETAQVLLTIGDETETYDISGLTKANNGYYLLQKNISAAQMNEDIHIQVVNGEDCGDKYTYSVRQYCDTILADEAHSEYHALVKEMLNYGAMAQVYFDYDADNVANDGITGTAATDIPETAEDMTISDNIDGLNFYGASLVYRDRIAVRYYFTGDVTGCTFTANGNTYTPVAKDGMHYIEIADILPQDLDQQVTLTVTDASGNTLTVTYGPMNYIVRMNEKGSADLQNLLKALYNYHLAAKAL